MPLSLLITTPLLSLLLSLIILSLMPLSLLLTAPLLSLLLPLTISLSLVTLTLPLLQLLSITSISLFKESLLTLLGKSAQLFKVTESEFGASEQLEFELTESEFGASGELEFKARPANTLWLTSVEACETTVAPSRESGSAQAEAETEPGASWLDNSSSWLSLKSTDPPSWPPTGASVAPWATTSPQPSPLRPGQLRAKCPSSPQKRHLFRMGHTRETWPAPQMSHSTGCPLYHTLADQPSTFMCLGIGPFRTIRTTRVPECTVESGCSWWRMPPTSPYCCIAAWITPLSNSYGRWKIRTDSKLGPPPTTWQG